MRAALIIMGTLRKNSATIFIAVFILLFACCVYPQDNASVTRELLIESLKEIGNELSSDPDNSELAKEFIFGCAMLDKWEDLAPVYKRVSAEMGGEEKQEMDESLLLIRTGQVTAISVDVEQKEVTASAIFLKTNPLESLSPQTQRQVEGYLEKALQFFREGNVTQGKRECEKALKLKETPLPYVYTGFFLHNSGRHAQAVAYLEKGIELAGEDNVTPYLFSVLVNAYVNSGLRDKGIVVLEEYVKNNPQNSYSLYQLANFYYEEREILKYLRVCENIRAMDPVAFLLLENSYAEENRKIEKMRSAGKLRAASDILRGIWRFFMKKQWKEVSAACDIVKGEHRVSIGGIVEPEKQDEIIAYLKNMNKDLRIGPVSVSFYERLDGGEAGIISFKQVDIDIK